MNREFEIRRETIARATPEAAFDAVATGDGIAAWLFPAGDVEPCKGGAAPFGGTVLEWEPPHRYVVRSEGPDGWFNQLDNEIEDRGDGTIVLRYVHSGVFTDDWDNQYDGANRHTDFYQHTLVQYLEHFAGQKATYVGADAPAAASEPGSFERVLAALGEAGSADVGEQVRIELRGLAPIEGVVDYRNEHFLGIRTDDALLRFFGRDAFGAPVFAGHHLFAPGVDGDAITSAWAAWLDGVFAAQRA